MDRDQVDEVFPRQLKENDPARFNIAPMRSSASNSLRLPLQQSNIEAQFPQASTSTFQNFGEIATHTASPNFRSVPIGDNQMEVTAYWRTYKLMNKLALKCNKKAFTKRQCSKKSPRLCWRIQGGMLRPTLICLPDCQFHRMKERAVFTKLKYDPKYKDYKKAYLKFREGFMKRTPSKSRTKNAVDDLERIFAHSHIDERNEVCLDELMGKMEAVVLYESSDDE